MARPKLTQPPHRKPWKILAALGVAAGTAAALWLLLPRERPNIILISIDSLRPDHVGCYGYGRNTSPTMDLLAREGALFETAVSSTSWTLPAHAALLTSLPDRVHGCMDDLKWLDGTRTTLAEALKAAGYRTAGFFSGPYLHPSFGFSQGFESYHDCTSYSKRSVELIKSGGLINDKIGQLSMDLMNLSHEDITNPIVLADVKSWLEKRPEGPFFLFIHLWDVHYDYVAPPPYDTLFDPTYKGPVNGRNVLRLYKKPAEWTDADVEHLKALYDGEIRFADDTIGQILSEVDRHGLKEKSILAVTSDHGEAFYEHGLQGHRWTLHEEELRIPLILRYPRSIPAGRRLKDPVGIIDIAPTLLDLAGLPPLPNAMGRSLTPLLSGSPAPLPAEPVISELSVPANRIHNFSIRFPDRKIIFDLSSRQCFVFDLAKDPGESSPLPEDKSPFKMQEIDVLYKATAEKLQQAATGLPMPGERDTPPISKMTEDQLRSLGYLK
jgi:arylsulfatase A-like enzyme